MIVTALTVGVAGLTVSTPLVSIEPMKVATEAPAVYSVAGPSTYPPFAPGAGLTIALFRPPSWPAYRVIVGLPVRSPVILIIL